MAAMAEPGEAGHHIRRIQLYVQAMARRLCDDQAFAELWPDARVDTLVRASALHDIGNSGVPDRILLKPGALAQDELDIMRTHPTIGRDLIDQIQRNAGGPSELLDLARDIVLCHHERWDGKGYPQGLAGDAIPVAAQLMTIADSYDALTSDRVYRAGVPHDKAIQLIFQQRGAQFAPHMVDALLEIEHAFADIGRRHADTEAELQKKMDYLAMAIAESA